MQSFSKNRNFNRGPQKDNDSPYEEKIVQVNRVSKKTKGGNKIGFSVLMVVGDHKGNVGVGLGKSPDVQSSIRKASTYAKKHMIAVPMRDATIPHEVMVKDGAARLILKPAAPGTGVIAGGAVRAVVEAAGIKDILSKVLGTSNKASNVYATLAALKKLRALQLTAAPKENGVTEGESEMSVERAAVVIERADTLEVTEEAPKETPKEEPKTTKATKPKADKAPAKKAAAKKK